MTVAVGEPAGGPQVTAPLGSGLPASAPPAPVLPPAEPPPAPAAPPAPFPPPFPVTPPARPPVLEPVRPPERPALPEAERPAQVVVAILTDGRENASKECGYESVRAILSEKATASGWQVLFLAADMSVVAAAVQMGLRRDPTSVFRAGGEGTRDAFRQVSRVVTGARTGVPGVGDPKKKPN